MPYYVLDENNNRQEAYTKEEILSVLAQAIQDGTLANISKDAGFITKLKCACTGITIKEAFITQEQYNALEAAGTLEPNTLYTIIDDTTCEDINATLEQINNDLQSLGNVDNSLIKNIKDIEPIIINATLSDGVVTTTYDLKTLNAGLLNRYVLVLTKNSSETGEELVIMKCGSVEALYDTTGDSYTYLFKNGFDNVIINVADIGGVSITYKEELEASKLTAENISIVDGVAYITKAGLYACVAECGGSKITLLLDIQKLIADALKMAYKSVSYNLFDVDGNKNYSLWAATTYVNGQYKIFIMNVGTAYEATLISCRLITEY